MKKLINNPENVVREALDGIALAHGDLVKVAYDPNFIYRADAPVQGKVALVSGGGSGHEPMHGGFVGYGMLDAACPGAVFTSPTPDQMLEATKMVSGGKGVVHIVKNYTGDILNFEMAADLAQAEGIEVEAVVTNDDVAVQDSLYTAGRRGVGVTVLVEKIAGAAAEQGRSLKEVADICRKVNNQGRSMGMALTSCTVPHAGKPTFELGDDEMEIGIGIHGEPGRKRLKLASADEITEMLAEPIIHDLPYKQGDSVLAFVNGLGGTPGIELYIIYRKLHAILSQHGIKVARSLVGSYMTSLEMAGTSITLVKLDDNLTALWDAPVEDTWTALGHVAMADKQQFINWLTAYAATLKENRDYLIQLDSAIGDADHGANMDRGFQAVVQKLPTVADKDIGTILKTTGMTLISTVGGAGGPLYGTVFLQGATVAAGKDSLTNTEVAALFEAALKGVMTRGKAEPGDKTMVDAMTPAVAALKSAVEAGASTQAALTQAAAAAEQGMQDTTPLVARKGRASYLGERSAGHQDPGATSTYLLFKTAAETLG